MKLIVGIDPGTGASSPTGLAIFEPETRGILLTEAITSRASKVEHRIREIMLQVDDRLATIDPDFDVEVYMESTVMRGKGGETLARMTGALMSVVPEQYAFDFVHNTTVKKLVGGEGRADKEMVALGVANFFGHADDDFNGWDTVASLIAGKAWDRIDALAIGIAGMRGGGRAARSGK